MCRSAGVLAAQAESEERALKAQPCVMHAHRRTVSDWELATRHRCVRSVS